MTIFRAPLANYKGEVMLSMQATGVIPAQATQFRGLWVTLNGLICATNDTGQARTYKGGFALEDPSGLLLVSDGPPASVPMDGINANAAGAAIKKTGAGSLIHQGVGMTVSAPGGPMIINQDEPVLTFHVPLEYGINSGTIKGNFVRNSIATQRRADGSFITLDTNIPRLGTAQDPVSGLLMEPETSNNFLNSENPVTQNISLLTGTYVLTVYGSGNVTTADAGGTATGHGTATEGNPVVLNVTVAGEFSFTVTGSLYGVQVERGQVPSSFIPTQGTIYTRQREQQMWPLVDSRGNSILNMAQGMLALQWTAAYSDSDVASGSTRYNSILRAKFGSGNDLIYFQRNSSGDNFFINRDTANYSTALITGGLVAGRLYLIAVRWNGAVKQIGFKTQGTWVWSIEGTYSGSFSQDGNLRLSSWEGITYMGSSRTKQIHMWSQDKGTAWLESKFSGMAN